MPTTAAPAFKVVYVQPTPAEMVKINAGFDMLARLMIEVLTEMRAEREAAEAAEFIPAA